MLHYKGSGGASNTRPTARSAGVGQNGRFAHNNARVYSEYIRCRQRRRHQQTPSQVEPDGWMRGLICRSRRGTAGARVARCSATPACFRHRAKPSGSLLRCTTAEPVAGVRPGIPSFTPPHIGYQETDQRLGLQDRIVPKNGWIWKSGNAWQWIFISSLGHKWIDVGICGWSLFNVRLGDQTMTAYDEVIKEQYRQMDSEELVERARSDSLTSSAQEIAVAELAKRGISLDRLSVDLATEMAVRDEVKKVRPWVRYWARMFDIYAFILAAGIMLGILSSGFIAKLNAYVLGMILVFAWVFVEALLLSTFQATPGKWLFKTKVSLTSGVPMNFSQALSRSLRVWWRGLGIGFAPVSLFTLITAHLRLTTHGITSWDKDGGFMVKHEKVGAWRVLTAIAFFIFVLMVSAIGKGGHA